LATTLTEPLLLSRQVSSGSCGSKDSARRQQANHIAQENAVGLTRRKSHLVPSHDDLKHRIHSSLHEPVYNVQELYHNDGLWQRVARNTWFNNLTLIVISANTIWIGYDTDNNKALVLCNAAAQFQIADNFFCCYFVFELVARLMAFRSKIDAFRDLMFVFDSCLVSLMVWETWIQVFIYLASAGSVQAGSHVRTSSILRVFRVFRLFRIARMARLVRNMPEVMILIKGITMATRSVVVVLSLLVLVIYIFAIIFTQLLSGTETAAGKFDDVPQAMNFLLMQVVCGFDEDAIMLMLAAGWIYYTLFLAFLLFGSLTLMNMLIGILCEVVSQVALVENEEMFLKEVEFQVGSVTATLDSDGSNTIDKIEFDQLTETPALMQNLQELGVDIVAFVDFANYIYNDHDELSFSAFLDTVVQFRGSKAATVKDVVDMRKFVSMELSSLEARLDMRAEALFSKGGGMRRRQNCTGSLDG